MKSILIAILATLAAFAGQADPHPTMDAALRANGIGGPAQNLSCGIPPIPPIGCRVGDCVCDQYGQNCRWTFVCN